MTSVTDEQHWGLLRIQDRHAAWDRSDGFVRPLHTRPALKPKPRYRYQETVDTDVFGHTFTCCAWIVRDPVSWRWSTWPAIIVVGFRRENMVGVVL